MVYFRIFSARKLPLFSHSSQIMWRCCIVKRSNVKVTTIEMNRPDSKQAVLLLFSDATWMGYVKSRKAAAFVENKFSGIIPF